MDLAWVGEDARLIFAARALRGFSYGFIGITIGVFLARLELNAVAAGAILTASLLGAAAFTLALAVVADRLGRRRVLVGLAVLMVVSCLVYAWTDNFWLLLIAALTGTLSPNSGEGGGPFVALEQAILPQTAPDSRRTRLFVLYNLLGSIAGAVGGLFSGVVGTLLGPEHGLAAFRVLFGAGALLALANVLLLARLSPSVERPLMVAAPAPTSGPRTWMGMHRSRGIVLRLAALFALDSVAGGFTLQSIAAFWFSERWGLGLDTLGPIFMGVNLLNAASYLLADRVAERVGLLNTIVFTHLPASVALLLVPLMPTVELAVLVFVGRQLLSQMDIPTRQSYTMAVVDPDERVAAASFTGVARSMAQVVAPLVAGYAMQVVSLGLPFYIAGSLKVIYDLSLWRTFRDVRPPEEIARQERQRAA